MNQQPLFRHTTRIIQMIILGILMKTSHSFWSAINRTIPEPYLDEIFHVPQAQRYWAFGRLASWDPKITTPPGVYFWSCGLKKVLGFFVGDGTEGEKGKLTIEDLRGGNLVLLYLLIFCLWAWSRIVVDSRSREQRQDNTSWTTSKQVLPREFVIVTFPLLYFFSALYYTDLFSALTVVLTCVVWEAGLRSESRLQKSGFQFLHLLFGLLSLASRQTNVFWSAVFLAGLQLVETVRQRTGRLHDVNVADAWFEDYVYLVFSLLRKAIPIIPNLVVDLWPQLTLLLSFASFVYWNQGVVLGDKSNHVATIHTPQLLYIWPFITFFSWPAMLPWISSLLTSRPPSTLARALPRPQVIILALILATASVHYNTIVHPFTLADNRHYTFYVFRILVLRQAWVKYAAVPIYLICAWLVVSSLGSHSGSDTPRTASGTATKSVQLQLVDKTEKAGRDKEQEHRSIGDRTNPTGNKTSFVLVWLIATSLSLVTAPLVEPRYFIMPWLIWRIYMPVVDKDTEGLRSEKTVKTDRSNKNQNNDKQPADNSNDFSSSSPPPTHTKSGSKFSKTYNRSDQSIPSTPKQQFLNPQRRNLNISIGFSLWLEFAWYATINAVTIYIFLNWAFIWLQEPDAVQRFMW